MDLDRRGFYQYHAAMMEPWDGPAAVCFTDGKMIGATLDRNGLRPCRYQVTTDGTVVLASEAGVLPADPKTIRLKGRLQPGRMFLVDTVQARIIDDEEIKADIVGRKPLLFAATVGAFVCSIPLFMVGQSGGYFAVAIVQILFMVLNACMAPVAAAYVELFPTKVRYTVLGGEIVYQH